MQLQDPLYRAARSLTGLSIGDAFGECFFGNSEIIQANLATQTVPEGPWLFTDDTIMAIAVFRELCIDGNINPDRLMQRFIRNHDADPHRGYGATLRRLLRETAEGGDYRQLAAAAFDGQGSAGNGAAMRVAPVGAWYYNDLEKIRELTTIATLVTHTHPEALQGALAVSIAVGLATKAGREKNVPSPVAFLGAVAEQLEPSATKQKIIQSTRLDASMHIATVAGVLGNGVTMLSQDTVPFALWCAAHNLRQFDQALWRAVSALGDRDTICAITGAVTIMSSDINTVPANWLEKTENWECSVFN